MEEIYTIVKELLKDEKKEEESKIDDIQAFLCVLTVKVSGIVVVVVEFNKSIVRIKQNIAHCNTCVE